MTFNNTRMTTLWPKFMFVQSCSWCRKVAFPVYKLAICSEPDEVAGDVTSDGIKEDVEVNRCANLLVHGVVAP